MARGTHLDLLGDSCCDEMIHREVAWCREGIGYGEVRGGWWEWGRGGEWEVGGEEGHGAPPRTGSRATFQLGQF